MPRKTSSPWKPLSEVIVDGISDVLMVLDARTYEVLAANESFRKTYGFGRGEWKGKTCYQVTHGRDRPCCETGEQCPVKDVLREGTSQAAEHRHQDTKGEERYYDIVVYPIHSPSGEVEKVIHIAREITQRKQMEKERIRTERMEAINQLVATLSHEIYNPLTGLLWACKDITDEKWIPADKLEYIRAMYEAAQRIRGVIEKMQGMKSDATKEYVQGIRMIDLNEDDEPDCPAPDGQERS